MLLDKIATRVRRLLNRRGVCIDAGDDYGADERAPTPIDMIKENLVAERIAIDSYRAMIAWFGTKDSTTRILLEKILAKEEEHASDMHDLLVAHQGTPMLRH